MGETAWGCRGVLCPLLWVPEAAHLGGLVGHGSRAAHTELLQPRPGKEQDSLLGEQVGAPKGGDGTQGSLRGGLDVSRVHPQGGLSDQLPPSSRPSAELGGPPESRAHSPLTHRHPRSPPHHLHTLAGCAQVADEQLQHGLTVEESTPA